MLSPTFRGGDGDGRNKPSLDHGKLQAALFAAASASAAAPSASGGIHGVADAEAVIPPTFFSAQITCDDDDEDDGAPAASAAAGESSAKPPSRRGRGPAVGAAESQTAPFLEHHRGGGGLLGGTASSSSGGVTLTEAAAEEEGEEEEADDESDLEGGDGNGGGVPLLRLSLRAQREFVAVATPAAASPLPLPPPPPRPPRKTKQRRAPAMATLTEGGIAFATKGGARAAGARRSTSAPSPSAPSPPSPSRSSRSLLPPLLPFSEILGAEALPRKGGSDASSLTSFLRNCAALSPQREPWLVRVHTVSKGNKLGDWKPRAISLLAPSPRAAKAWASSISSSAASSHPGRPRSLLVLLNPYGGAKGAARRVWLRVAQPLLEGAAGIRCEVLETDSAGHAERAVRALSLARLRSLDGVVVVGGDGLFQEALNGLLAIRFDDGSGGSEEEEEASLSSPPPPPSSSASSPPPSSSASSNPTSTSSSTSVSSLRSLEASRLRLGHIPAGSTDALAWSVHGTRCPAAAALHVALGDGARLDVLALGPVPLGLLVEKGAGAAAAASCPPAVSEEEESSSSSREDATGRSPLTPRGAPTSSSGNGNGGEGGDTGNGCNKGNGGNSSSSAAAAAAAPAAPLPSPPTTAEWPPRAAACMASCGYFGDLLALSEKMRWLGPARYGVAGFLTLAFLKKYELRIRYLPAESESEGVPEGGGGEGTPRTPATGPLLPGAVGRAFARQQQQQEPAAAAAAAAASASAAAAAAAAVSAPPHSSPPTSEWKTVEGSFSAVLLACLPCRSDRSSGGVAPDRAMADGLASLVRVRACSRLQFLRFLVSVSKDGARVVEEAAAAVSCSGGGGGAGGEGGGEGRKKPDGRRKKGSGGAAALPWVSVVAVRAVAVEPLSAPPPSPSSRASSPSSRASSPSTSSSSYLPWNADGETLPASGVAAVVRKGLVRVFARPQLDDDDDDG